ncbi:MAG: HelD family protein [Clostridia bacterium]
MSQISEVEYKLEEKYLETTLKILHDEYMRIEKQYIKRSDSLKDYRRYLWENRRDFNNLFDIAEYEDRLREDIRGYEAISGRRTVIKSALNNPYFARIDFVEKNDKTSDKIYIGITSIIERDNFNIYVMDWRAPVSSMYYDYELGKAQYNAPDGIIKGVITLKRQYKIKNGNLQLAVDTGIKIDDVLLLEALSESSNIKMQQIVYTIQKEQNKIIRDDESETLWIQGVAGSGKTSVALHRVAYLLYHNRKRLDANSIAIFSPHPVFRDYISNVLPELGENNAHQLTFFDFTQNRINQEIEVLDISEQYLALENKNKQRMNSIMYKSGRSFLDVIEKYVLYLEKKAWKFRDIIFAGQLVFSAKEAEELFNEKYSHIPLNKRLDQVVNRIVYLVSLKYKKVNESKLKAVIYENGPQLDAIQLYRDLFLNLNLWVEIGVKHLPENFTSICQNTVKSISNHKLYYEDISPVIYLKHKVEEPLTNSNFKQIVVDEVQTYSVLQLKLFKEIFSEAKFTFLGDIYQNMNPFINWKIDDIEDILNGNINYYQLNRCYRSTMEIAQLAKDVYPESGIEYIDRKGSIPELRMVNKENLLMELNHRLKSMLREDNESYAIITNTLKEAKWLVDNLKDYETKLITGNSRQLSKNINVLPAHMIKGLEFDSIIYLNQKTVANKDKAYLYTIITRALHEFNIISTEKMSILDSSVKNGYIKQV